MNIQQIFRALTWVQGAVLALAGTAFAASDKLYVANEDEATVSVIDTVERKSVAKIPMGQKPHNVQVAPDGQLAWVTNNGARAQGDAGHQGGSGHDHGATAQAGEIWGIDTRTHQVVARIGVGLHPAHVVVTPDGRLAYVTNGGEGTVSVVDLASQKVTTTVTVGAYPHGIRISPDGKQAYVANLKSGTVSVIDTDTQKQVAQIPVGKAPAQVGFTPDGQRAFVSLSGENRVAVIDPVARKVVATVKVGPVPIQLYATPDSRTLLVANQGSRAKPGKTVDLIDLATLKVSATFQTGAGAHGVVVDTGGRHAYISNTYANTVSVLDLTSRKVLATVPVGRGPNGISMAP